MKALLLSVAVMMGMAAGSAHAQRGTWPSGNTYIYPEGTIGYYVGNYRSNYYYIPPVNNGFYGPPPQAYGYNMQRPRLYNNYYQNYPGFYYQQNGNGYYNYMR